MAALARVAAAASKRALLPPKKGLDLTRIRTMASKPVEKTVKLPSSGQVINYAQSGDGPKKILMLPGALGTGAGDFPPQMDPVAGLASLGPFSVIAWDPPGYGKSRPPARSFPLDFFLRDAAAAAELVKTAFGPDEKVNLLGWSDGGITALVMAVDHKDVVDRAAIWGANSYISERDIAMISKVRDVSGWSERMRKPMEEIYGAEGFPK